MNIQILTISYAFTIKLNTAGTPALTDYDYFFTKITKLNLKLINKYPERDSKGHLHIHGTFRGPVNFYYKKLFRKGYSVYIEPIKSEKAWNKYILKDQFKKSLFHKEH